MTEDIKFLNWLATGYNNSGLANWDHENYENEACLRYKESDVVYLVWQDDTKPANVDYLLCKNHQTLVGAIQYGLIPCKSKDGARRLWEVLLVRGGPAFQI